MRFRRPDDPVVFGIWCATFFVLACCVIAMFFVPQPTSSAQISAIKKNQAKAEFAIKDDNKTAEIDQKTIADHAWPESESELTPLAMSRISQIALRCGLKLTAFRPVKGQLNGGLNMIPITLSVQGRFLQIVNFAQTIESTQPRIALSSMQLASSDANSDSVQATVGIVAYSAVVDQGGANG